MLPVEMQVDCLTYLNSGGGGGGDVIGGGEPSRKNGSISTPVQDHYPFFFSFWFCLLFVEQNNRLLDSTCAS